MAGEGRGSSAESPSDVGYPPPRLLYLVTEDWYFCSHRLPVARAARDAGWEVHVATRINRHGPAISAEGFVLHPLGWRRGSLNPLAAAIDLWRLVMLFRRVRPKLVHLVAVKPALLGGLAATLARVPAVVTTLAGRGLALTGDGVRARAGGLALRGILALAGLGRPSATLVQNPDDASWLDRWPRPPGLAVVPGSGVDLARFAPLDDPVGPFTVAQVSRMLELKGVADLVEAVRLMRARGPDIRLILAGTPDPESRAAIPEDTLRAWASEPWVQWWGHVDDVRTVWQAAHVAVLASHGGEGVPKSLLEAAACGRALVATDVPGSRSVACDGLNALTVPPRDHEALAAALARLADDPALRLRLAAASRGVVDPAMGEAAIAAATCAVYRRLLSAFRRPGVSR